MCLVVPRLRYVAKAATGANLQQHEALEAVPSAVQGFALRCGLPQHSLMSPGHNAWKLTRAP